MKDKILPAMTAALLVVLTVLVLNLSSEIEIAKNDLDGIHVDMAIASDFKPQLEQLSAKLDQRFVDMEKRIDENRRNLAAMEEKTGAFLKKITKVLKEVGADPSSVEGTSSSAPAGEAPFMEPRAHMAPPAQRARAERDLEAALGPTTPALMEFPGKIVQVDQVASPDLSYQHSGADLILYGGGALDEDKASLKVMLANGDLYHLKIKRANYSLRRTIAAKVVEAGAGAQLKQIGREFVLRLESSRPVSVMLPSAIVAGFKRKTSPFEILAEGSVLTITSRTELDDKGEALLLKLSDGRVLALRGQRATTQKPALASVDLTGLPSLN